MGFEIMLAYIDFLFFYFTSCFSGMAYYPAEWDDDERIRVLMSPMPSDEVAKQSRITFWSSAIRNWCRKTNVLQFNIKVRFIHSTDSFK